MIEERTVLVLGAGASKPYGLPLGYELRDAVLTGPIWVPTGEVVHGDIVYESATLDSFCLDLAESGFSSVDAFLENRPRWTDVGKCAMAVRLLESESQAKNRLFPPHQPQDHWYEYLWSQMRASTWPAFKKQRLRVITFNYDRSLEHYLCRVVCNNYGVKADTAMRALSVLHVHGSLGRYDGTFGGPINEASYAEATDAIRVIHEADKQDPGFATAREWLASAERVLFVGFGYLAANMRKLGFRTYTSWRPVPDDRLIAGTHKGIRQREWGALCRKYGFSHEAESRGAGSTVHFLSESLH